MSEQKPVDLSTKRRGRNIALALALAAWVALMYVLTFVKMGGGT
jgi:hypothetical protein